MLSLPHTDYRDLTHVYTDGFVASTSSVCAVVVPARQTEMKQLISHGTPCVGAQVAALRALRVQHIGQK